jgi:hypothetical protein
LAKLTVAERATCEALLRQMPKDLERQKRWLEGLEPNQSLLMKELLNNAFSIAEEFREKLQRHCDRQIKVAMQPLTDQSGAALQKAAEAARHNPAELRKS